MNRRIIRRLKSCYKAPMFSPKGFLARAIFISAAFLIFHAIGLRQYTTILSGTSQSGDTADMWAVFVGMTYIVLYFAFVLGVPILILASAVFSLVQIGAARARISRRKYKAGPQEPASEKPSSTAAQ